MSTEVEAPQSIPSVMGEIMTPRPVCVAPDEHLDVARAVMVASRFRYAADLSLSEASERERGLHLRGLTARRIMHQPVIVAPSTARVEAAAQALLHHRISSLPIVDEGKLVGIATYRDFLAAAVRRLEDAEARGGTTIRVARLMTPRPIATVQPEDRLDVVWSIMKSFQVRHLPVVNGEWLVGLISDHDLLAADGSWLNESLAVRLERRAAMRARQIMSERVLTAAPDEPATAAAELLRHRHVGALAVLRAGRLSGMISAVDYLNHLVAESD
jgi:CBS domain-containing protein